MFSKTSDNHFFKNNTVIITFFLAAIFLLLTVGIVEAKQKRVALVIGNSNYKNSPLKNPANDARDMSKKLKQYGFQVDSLINANLRQMKKAISRFGKKLNQEGTVGLFFFAGHGVQVSNSNFLIPIGATIESESEVEFEAVNAARILSRMSQADNGLNLMILDACRNNPFQGEFRSGTRGLAKMQAPNGSVILYATSPGSVAGDGAKKNGLFTEKLLKSMSTKGLKIEDVFKQTAIAVSNASDKKQVPYFEGVILGDFYFEDKVNIIVNNPPKYSPLNASNNKQNALHSQENIFWNSVDKNPSIEAYKAYLEEFKNGRYKVLAEIKIKQLSKQKTRHQPTINEPIVKKSFLTKLTVKSNVYEDMVIINGEEKGSTALSIDLKPGLYALEVSKEGYRTWEHNLQINGQEEQMIYAKLVKSNIPKISTYSNQTSSDQVSEVIRKVSQAPAPVRKSRRRDSSLKSIKNLSMVKVGAGCFNMGAKTSHNDDDKPKHKVCISRSFYIGKYEVTQGQWTEVMGNNPSKYSSDKNRPVEQVSWNDVQEFIAKLNESGKYKYRLPTEAEWEYACTSRGKNHLYCGGSTPSRYAWFGQDWNCTHRKVGLKSPNKLGLYDMSGNVSEWVHDWYSSDYYSTSPESNPKGPADGSRRSARGGSCQSEAEGIQSTVRNGSREDNGHSDMGFRLVREF